MRVSRLRDPADLARIGRVTLTGSREDFPVFDAVFAAWFGDAPGVPTATPEEETAAPPRDRPGREALIQLAAGAASGRAASPDEIAGARTFRPAAEDERRALARLRPAFARLPEVERRRWVPSPAGRRLDLARTGRAARRTFGETLHLFRQAREVRPRRLLLLVDVSGSMQAQSETTLRFAQALTRARGRVETFTFGTRLTRVTAALRRRDGDAALARLAAEVSDFDGGTRIGEAFETFLARLTNAALARGAVVVVFSDGLERGDPGPMIAAVHRLARLAHRLVWASPLAADPRYRPVTRAMAGILPDLDALVDGSSLAAMACLPERIAAIERRPRGEAWRAFRERRRMIGIVDGHHHIWRQADLPWLQGPMVPRIFGPYEPIRRDYPIEEYLADIAGTGVEKSVYVQTNWAKAGAVDEVAWVQATADAHGWPHAIVGYADLLDDERRRGAEAAGRLPADARRAHAAALAREPAIPLRAAARPDGRRRASAATSAASPTTAGPSTCRSSPRRWRTRRGWRRTIPTSPSCCSTAACRRT